MTMTRGESDAETCRLNGWTVGTRLAGDEGHEGYGVTVIKITAIGDLSVLAVAVSHDGHPVSRWEGEWTLTHREWSEAP